MRIEPGKLSFFGNQLFQSSANLAVIVVPDTAGYEIQANENRLHFTMQENKLNFKMNDNRLDFEMEKNQ